MFQIWLDKDKRSTMLSLMIYCARGLMIADLDTGAIKAVISKLSVIYNNQPRAHTTILRAEKRDDHLPKQHAN